MQGISSFFFFSFSFFFSRDYVTDVAGGACHDFVSFVGLFLTRPDAHHNSVAIDIWLWKHLGF